MQATTDHAQIAAELPAMARAYGFEQAGVADIDLAEA